MNLFNYASLSPLCGHHPWAVLPERVEPFRRLLQSTMRGEALSISAVQQPGATQLNGATAVIPVRGLIFHRENLFTEYGMGTSVERLAKQFRQVMADPQVAKIVLSIDSPGGQADGIDEIAAEIHAARSRKSIVAHVDTLAASAGYWIASAASEIIATSSSKVGSIGVYMVHIDYSGLNAQMGIKPEYIAAGQYKTEGNPDEPLTDEARAYFQSLVNSHYDTFVMAVAKGRGVRKSEVLASYGQGRVLLAQDALAAGMIDRIATIDQVLTNRSQSRSGQPGARARDLDLLSLSALSV